MSDTTDQSASEKRWQASTKPGQKVAVITQIGGKQAGRSWVVESEKPIRIGRDPRCAISVTEEDCSKQHLEIHYYATEGTPPQVWVKDLGSTNGSYLEHARLAQNHEVIWDSGKTLTLSHTVQFTANIVTSEDAEYLLWTSQIAHRDGTTALLNTEGLLEVLQREASFLAGNPESQIALMIIKIFNHSSSPISPEADRPFQFLLNALRPKLRAGTILARTSPLELTLLLRKCDVEAAHVVIRRLSDTLDDTTAATGILGRNFPALVVTMAALMVSGKYHPEAQAILEFAQNQLFEADTLSSNRTVMEYVPRLAQ